jgi:hypothetical protein
MSCTAEYWQGRLEAKQALLAALEDALTAISVNGAQEYHVKTGQTDMRVVRAEVGALRNTITRLEGEIDTLCARLGYDGARAVAGLEFRRNS